MPRADIPILVTDPRGPQITVVSGSKAEHGAGGWEINAWGSGTYTVEFEDQSFEVLVDGQTVIATFTESTGPAQARLVSVWMDEDQATSILQALEDQYPDIFLLTC